MKPAIFVWTPICLALVLGGQSGPSLAQSKLAPGAMPPALSTAREVAPDPVSDILSDEPIKPVVVVGKGAAAAVAHPAPQAAPPPTLPPAGHSVPRKAAGEPARLVGGAPSKREGRHVSAPRAGQSANTGAQTTAVKQAARAVPLGKATQRAEGRRPVGAPARSGDKKTKKPNETKKDTRNGKKAAKTGREGGGRKVPVSAQAKGPVRAERVRGSATLR